MATVTRSALLLLAALAGCTSAASTPGGAPTPSGGMNTPAPHPDPRIGLKAGMMDAQEAVWNLRVVSRTPPSGKFLGSTNSDLAFTGHYVIQGNYNGYQVWDIADPAHPVLKTSNYCPASQSDVSVYRNLLFVSAEGNSGRIDCGDQAVQDTVSKERIRGIRIFDMSDIEHMRNVANVQTCRGSHTHSVLVDPRDQENVYVYVSGSAGIRSPSELAGCMNSPDDPNTSRFRIEVIKVPLAHPEQAAIVTSPRIFENLAAVTGHGLSQGDIEANKKAVAEARATGGFVVTVKGVEQVPSSYYTGRWLDSIVKARGGSGAPTAADTATLRAVLPELYAAALAARAPIPGHPGVTSCHDITLYPAIGMAGGACEGYGLLIDIKDPANPVRTAAVADSNFSYWHSATFNNDGTKILFSDEWGGGGGPKCRANDPREWGADAIFTIENGKLRFQSYYKLPVVQTSFENCVAHNGSMIPIPGRDVMSQSWYQGGVSVFDWTDPAHPKEIAFHDRGPADSTRMGDAGTWSAYWYNGLLVSSEIGRGLDIFELTPSPFISANEIAAAKTVRFDYFNTQGQQKFVWPPSFPLANAYLDQLERNRGMGEEKISRVRKSLSQAEAASGTTRRDALTALAGQLEQDAGGARDPAKLRKLIDAVKDLANATK